MMVATEDRKSSALANDPAVYHPVATAAIVGCAMGVLSPLAFVHPLLWALPVAAALVCLLALWQIARRTPELIGRRAALFGLSLALLIGAAAPARYFVIGARSHAEAKQLISLWLEAVRRRDLQQAADFMRDVSVHKLAGEADKVITPDDDFRRPRGPLAASIAARAVMSLGESAKFRFVSGDDLIISSTRERTTTLWEVSGEYDGKPTHFQLRISADHILKDPRRVLEWRVTTVYFVDSPPEWLAP